MPHSGWTRTATLAVLLLLHGCDGFYHDAAPPEAVALSVATFLSPDGPALNPALAGVFDRTNRVRVRVEMEESGQVLADEFQDVTTDSEGIRLQLLLDLPEEAVRVRLQVFLFLDGGLLFDGSIVTELRRGRPVRAEVPIVARASGLQITGPSFISALREDVQLSAQLVMVTGDLIPNATFTWIALDPSVVSVNQSGLATSLTEGEARIVAVSQGLADTLRVRVEAVVASVQVTPPEATVLPGATASFQASARDSRGNVLARPVAWTTSNISVATVSQAGVATGGLVGDAEIRATAGGVVGTATLRVRPPPPVVMTGQPQAVTSTGATLTGTVNPSGARTDAWFEFGTNPGLTGFQSTARATVGIGASPVPFSQFVGGLEPETTLFYRVVAENPGGVVQGQILSFVTPALTLPLAPSGLQADPVLSSLSEFLGFRLTWDDNSNNEDQFEVERFADAQSGEFVLVGITPANQNSFVDSGAQMYYYYEYRVRACNVVGCSDYSTPVGVYYDDFSGGYYRQHGAASGPSGWR